MSDIKHERTEKHIGDLVTLVPSYRPFDLNDKSCLQIGHVYKVINRVFHNNNGAYNFCDITIEKCSNDHSAHSYNGDVFTIVKSVFEMVTPEEEAKAAPLSSFNLDDAIKFF